MLDIFGKTVLEEKGSIRKQQDKISESDNIGVCVKQMFHNKIKWVENIAQKFGQPNERKINKHKSVSLNLFAKMECKNKLFINSFVSNWSHDYRQASRTLWKL